ncbi:MAG TPA: hypothetical protein VJ579_03350 [Candidatus Paceibacterota bacterium]|nr:hypothetical protein [Candidatus Paceibacterota bacterium]
MQDNTLLEAIGVLGSIMVLGAFALNSFGVVESSSTVYQIMNLVGGSAFVYYTFKKTAWSSLVVNVAWVIIALVALYRIFFLG